MRHGPGPAGGTPPWLQWFPANLLKAILHEPYGQLLNTLNQLSRAGGLVSGGGYPLQFVPQSMLPTDHAYESWIAQTGQVPTRDNPHDRYNALIWLCCPVTKARLNHLQAAEIAKQGVGGRRGPIRDAATLCDENLLVLVCHEQAQFLSALLASADWKALFLEHRACWHREWQPMVFGHALLEKLHRPYKSITAHCLLVGSAQAEWPAIDTLLAEHLGADPHPNNLMPLPVMGIPGWDPSNAADGFYQDAAVFRPARAARSVNTA